MVSVSVWDVLAVIGVSLILGGVAWLSGAACVIVAGAMFLFAGLWGYFDALGPRIPPS